MAAHSSTTSSSSVSSVSSKVDVTRLTNVEPSPFCGFRNLPPELHDIIFGFSNLAASASEATINRSICWIVHNNGEQLARYMHPLLPLLQRPQNLNSTQYRSLLKAHYVKEADKLQRALSDLSQPLRESYLKTESMREAHSSIKKYSDFLGHLINTPSSEALSSMRQLDVISDVLEKFKERNLLRRSADGANDAHIARCMSCLETWIIFGIDNANPELFKAAIAHAHLLERTTLRRIYSDLCNHNGKSEAVVAKWMKHPELIAPMYAQCVAYCQELLAPPAEGVMEQPVADGQIPEAEWAITSLRTAWATIFDKVKYHSQFTREITSVLLPTLAHVPNDKIAEYIELSARYDGELVDLLMNHHEIQSNPANYPISPMLCCSFPLAKQLRKLLDIYPYEIDHQSPDPSSTCAHKLDLVTKRFLPQVMSRRGNDRSGLRQQMLCLTLGLIEAALSANQKSFDEILESLSTLDEPINFEVSEIVPLLDPSYYLIVEKFIDNSIASHSPYLAPFLNLECVTSMISQFALCSRIKHAIRCRADDWILYFVKLAAARTDLTSNLKWAIIEGMATLIFRKLPRPLQQSAIRVHSLVADSGFQDGYIVGSSLVIGNLLRGCVDIVADPILADRVSNNFATFTVLAIREAAEKGHLQQVRLDVIFNGGDTAPLGMYQWLPTIGAWASDTRSSWNMGNGLFWSLASGFLRGALVPHFSAIVVGGYADYTLHASRAPARIKRIAAIGVERITMIATAVKWGTTVGPNGALATLFYAGLAGMATQRASNVNLRHPAIRRMLRAGNCAWRIMPLGMRMLFRQLPHSVQKMLYQTARTVVVLVQDPGLRAGVLMGTFFTTQHLLHQGVNAMAGIEVACGVSTGFIVMAISAIQSVNRGQGVIDITRDRPGFQSATEALGLAAPIMLSSLGSGSVAGIVAGRALMTTAASSLVQAGVARSVERSLRWIRHLGVKGTLALAGATGAGFVFGGPAGAIASATATGYFLNRHPARSSAPKLIWNR